MILKLQGEYVWNDAVFRSLFVVRFLPDLEMKVFLFQILFETNLYFKFLCENKILVQILGWEMTFFTGLSVTRPCFRNEETAHFFRFCWKQTTTSDFGMEMSPFRSWMCKCALISFLSGQMNLLYTSLCETRHRPPADLGMGKDLLRKLCWRPTRDSQNSIRNL